MSTRAGLSLITALMWLSGCSEPLPPDVEGYASNCIQLNSVEIPPYPDDPHDGYKTVYACHTSVAELEARSYPEGALVVKAARKQSQDYPFLIATARKENGEWRWAEYTRNFDNEGFLKLPIAEAVCVDCHRTYEALDWIMTGYDGGAP